MALSIQDLPEEIRALIYKKLPQQDLVHSVRLVCHQWRSEVDNLCDFNVELDDRKEGWQRILELRIKFCKIIHFLKSPPNGPPGTTILTHKNLLKNLKISESISPSNFYYILSDCAPNLVSLEVSLSMNLIGFPFATSFAQFNFEKLKKFSIKVTTLPNYSPRTDNEEGNNNNNNAHAVVPFAFLGIKESKNIEEYFSQFMASAMSSLKCLNIKIRCLSFNQVSKFTGLTLNFLALHWRQLKAFDFDLLVGHGLPSSEFRPLCDEDLSKINFALLKKLVGLTYLRIISSSPAGINLWLDLLERQTSLSFLEMDILPAPSSIFRDAIQKNCTTLVSIEITDLTIWEEDGTCTPFDMTSFQSCKVLKKLILDRNVTRRRIFDTAELINLFNLPGNIDELALNYFNVLSDEFILLANNAAGENLKTLYLTQCGCSGFFGVDGSVLEKIIGLPLITFIEISSLNFSDADESEKLNMILETFGYSQNHSYFQLAKTTHQIPIQFHAFVVRTDDDGEEEEEEEEVDEEENEDEDEMSEDSE